MVLLCFYLLVFFFWPLNSYESQKESLRYFMFAQQFSTGKPEALCRHVMQPGLPCRENQARLAPVTPPGRAPPVPFRLRADVLTPEKPSRSTGHCGVCPASLVSPPRPASVAAPGPGLHRLTAQHIRERISSSQHPSYSSLCVICTVYHSV